MVNVQLLNIICFENHRQWLQIAKFLVSPVPKYFFSCYKITCHLLMIYYLYILLNLWNSIFINWSIYLYRYTYNDTIRLRYVLCIIIYLKNVQIDFCIVHHSRIAHPQTAMKFLNQFRIFTRIYFYIAYLYSCIVILHVDTGIHKLEVYFLVHFYIKLSF